MQIQPKRICASGGQCELPLTYITPVKRTTLEFKRTGDEIGSWIWNPSGCDSTQVVSCNWNQVIVIHKVSDIQLQFPIDPAVEYQLLAAQEEVYIGSLRAIHRTVHIINRLALKFCETESNRRLVFPPDGTANFNAFEPSIVRIK